MLIQKSKYIIQVAAAFFVFSLSPVISAYPQVSPWTTNDDMLLFFEAITKIEKKFPDRPAKKTIIQGALKAYLRGLDPYSDYLSAEEFKNFKASRNVNYVGIGMEIERTLDGRMICFPYPGGPAEKSGIEFGDFLEAIDGSNITGKNLITISNMSRGEKGTTLFLTVQKKNGKRENIKVKREPVRVETVVKKVRGGFTVIQILSFNKSTQRDLKYALMSIDKKAPLIIDLRGNSGGDLYSAIDSAMLFLKKGKKIVDIMKSDKVSEYKCTGNTLNTTSLIYLWHNEKTASAAEVFIAALVQNKRAVSIGKKTYGKGTTQEIIELSDGSAIFLTTGIFQTPDGTRYHGKGIRPKHLLEAGVLKMEDYLSKVKELEKKKKNKSDKKKDALTTPTNSDNQLHFICFSKYFDTEEDIKILSMEIKNSFDELKTLYNFEKKDGNGTKKYSLCLGTYDNREEAEKDRIRISQGVDMPMYLDFMTESEFKFEIENVK